MVRSKDKGPSTLFSAFEFPLSFRSLVFNCAGHLYSPFDSNPLCFLRSWLHRLSLKRFFFYHSTFLNQFLLPLIIITHLQQHTGSPSSKTLGMHFSLFTTTILLFASLTTAFSAPSPIARLETRQQQQVPITCADYSRLANYTAINSNSSLRAAFLQASPQGTNPTRVILDSAVVEFNAKKLKFDAALNAQCGNLSTIAATEVDRNFSQGIISGFKVVAPVGAEIGAVYHYVYWVWAEFVESQCVRRKEDS
jgi:hypothetical protein